MCFVFSASEQPQRSFRYYPHDRWDNCTAERLHARQPGNTGAGIQIQAVWLQGLRLLPLYRIASLRKHLIQVCERMVGLTNSYLVFSPSGTWVCLVFFFRTERKILICSPHRFQKGPASCFKNQARVFVLILRQWFPEPHFCYPEGRSLFKHYHVMTSLCKRQQLLATGNFFFCKYKNPIGKKSVAWQITNQRQSLLHEDLKLKNFDVLNNIESEADGWMP